MALRIHLLSTLFSSNSSSPISTIFFTPRLSTRLSCTTNNNGIGDAALASELAARATTINTSMLQTEKAMTKSRELLFGQLCEYMGLKEDEAKLRWSKMDEDQKWGLVKGFVAEWGAHFHPLSARSTKEMVEEYLRQGKGNPSTDSPPPPPPPPPPPAVLIPGIRRMIGFS